MPTNRGQLTLTTQHKSITATADIQWEDNSYHPANIYNINKLITRHIFRTATADKLYGKLTLTMQHTFVTATAKKLRNINS